MFLTSLRNMACLLSSVLRSQRANIQIIRIFVKFRQMFTNNTQIRLEIAIIELKQHLETRNIQCQQYEKGLIF
jgi:hypothetical protein